MLTRRAMMATSLAGGVAASCSQPPPPLPSGDVVAAGQPAALLIWAVARDRLAGWPRKPGSAALSALPPLAGSLPEIGALAGSGRPADVEAIAALRPRMIIDYGDADAEHQGLAGRMHERLGVEWLLLDGSLSRIPVALRDAGRLLEGGVAAENLADAAESVLERWRTAPAGPSFYYARGSDGLETGFRGALATEVLEGAGWTNVATGSTDIGRVDIERVVAWDPEAVITLDPAFARAAASDPVWRTRRNGARRDLLLLPDTPFGWIDRPPSVNRLLGCAWLAEPKAAWIRLSMLAHRLYGRAPREAARPRWIA